MFRTKQFLKIKKRLQNNANASSEVGRYIGLAGLILTYAHRIKLNGTSADDK